MRKPVVHDLKAHPDPFAAVLCGDKLHEIRWDDRGFMKGDILRLKEFLPEPEKYTGAELSTIVTHISRGPDWGLPVGLVVMSVRVISTAP